MRRASILAWLTLVPLASSCGVMVASTTSSCASEVEEGAADAVSDSPRLGEGGPAEAAAEPPLGDPCGDRQGLEPNAPWPMRGGCPKRAGYFPGVGPATATVKWTLPVAASASSPALSADGIVWFG